MFELAASIIHTANFSDFSQAIATMGVTSRRSGHPGEHQLLVMRTSSQLIWLSIEGNLSARKQLVCPHLLKRATHVVHFSRSHPHFSVNPTLRVLFDMIVSLKWTKLSQWLSYLQASSYTGPPCPDTERHPRRIISRCSARSAQPCTPSCPRSHGTGRTAKPGSHCVF